MMESTVEIIKDMGFPIAISLYLLYKDHKFTAKTIVTLEKMTGTLDNINLYFNRRKMI